jgi:hypothetical protein
MRHKPQLVATVCNGLQGFLELAASRTAFFLPPVATPVLHSGSIVHVINPICSLSIVGRSVGERGSWSSVAAPDRVRRIDAARALGFAGFVSVCGGRRAWLGRVVFGEVFAGPAVGVPEDKLWLLATAELAGAAGVVAGLFWWPIGVVAASGVVLCFIAAIGAHIRVKDRKIAPALVMLVAAATVLILRAITT